MIEAVVFDFDGLIRDTETFEFYSFQELLMDYGVELPLDLYSSRIGGHFNSFDPYEFLQSSIGQSLDKELLRTLRREKYEKLMVDQKCLPGVEKCLNEATELGIKIGLASSAPRDWVLPNLEELGLTHYFSCIRTNEDVENVKPAPDLYIEVLKHFGIRASNAIAFEDSPNGAKAAKAAGMYCVIVPNELTKALPFESYDLRLESLAELKLETAIRVLTNMQET